MTAQMQNAVKNPVLVVDFGGQYTHLVVRRIRELGVYAIVEPFTKLERLDPSSYKAVVLSGSHKSVVSLDPLISEGVHKILYQSRTPVLGICYGHQLIARVLGGAVSKDCGEYGRTRIRVLEEDPLFKGWEMENVVWMSHGDCVDRLPDHAKILALSENGYIAAFKAEINGRPIYGVQFHPEVSHTAKGLILFDNFLRIIEAPRAWTPQAYLSLVLEEAMKELSQTSGKAVAAVSGGVDSAVAAVIAQKAIGSRLIPVFVDHGLFRENESREVLDLLRRVGLDPIYVDARERFISKLEGVVDCEQRRRIIGEEFAKVFDEIMEKEGADTFVQGTIYPDIVESGTHLSEKIKTHHNVAGLPAWFREKYRVVEPLKYLYKDEVRKVGEILGIPHDILARHPFPGPGLAARIVGPFTREKLEICRRASRIIEEVLKNYGLYDKVWQAFAVVGEDKWVGVKGDSRRHGFIVIVRVVESQDAMTADYTKLPYEVLDEISRRITVEIDNVTMVAYAVTTKPPSTIEPC